jgi:hypothetical protein
MKTSYVLHKFIDNVYYRQENNFVNTACRFEFTDYHLSMIIQKNKKWK